MIVSDHFTPLIVSSSSYLFTEISTGTIDNSIIRCNSIGRLLEKHRPNAQWQAACVNKLNILTNYEDGTEASRKLTTKAEAVSASAIQCNITSKFIIQCNELVDLINWSTAKNWGWMYRNEIEQTVWCGWQMDVKRNDLVIGKAWWPDVGKRRTAVKDLEQAVS